MGQAWAQQVPALGMVLHTGRLEKDATSHAFTQLYTGKVTTLFPCHRFVTPKIWGILVGAFSHLVI